LPVNVNANSEKPVALVTGANRGIGFEVSRQIAARGYRVLMTARDDTKGQKAARILINEGYDVVFYQLDVQRLDEQKVVNDLRFYIDQNLGRVDALINNAGVFLDPSKARGGSPSVFDSKLALIRQTMDINVYGPLVLTQLVMPYMRRQHHGRIVNVSSGMGQMSEMGSGYPAYRLSKVSLNALTKIVATEVEQDFHEPDILCNTVCPGWVQTDMGGAGATIPVTQGAEMIVWLATLPKNAGRDPRLVSSIGAKKAINGLFMRGKKVLSW
jgi:NAD(P)-dependent dehydrogenase (short-subunit alcohol dehydrogenase family)